MAELTELATYLLEQLNITNVSDIPIKLMRTLETGKEDFFDKWLEHFPDLSTDYFQPIFQYYLADRKEKMQDYTPPSLARLCVKLALLDRDIKSIYDMCAGSGALTIQAWNIKKDCLYVCEEFDEAVIPFLLCNLAMRNMNAIVIRGDVICGERFTAWKLKSSEKYSDIIEILPPNAINADICISNPPYNMKWVQEPFIQLDERFLRFGVPPASNANYVFVLSALRAARRCALILPKVVLQGTAGDEKEIISNLVNANKIDSIVLNPDSMFECTSIGTCVLCLDSEKNTAFTTFIDARQTYTETIREQRGQYGGKSHTNRVYTKAVKEYNAEQIDRIVSAVMGYSSEAEFSKSVNIENIKANGYNLAPSRYIEFSEQEVPHRSYPDIVADINRTRKEQNCCKLVINETLAKRLGFNLTLFSHENDDGLEQLLVKIAGKGLEKCDYIQFTKKKNELTFKNTSSESISSVLMMILTAWKQHIYYLNEEENRYLAELRDALLPELSGKIEL